MIGKYLAILGLVVPLCYGQAVPSGSCQLTIFGPSSFTICAGKDMPFPTFYSGLNYEAYSPDIPYGTEVYAWDLDPSANSTGTPAEPGIGRIDDQYKFPGMPAGMPHPKVNSPMVVSGDNGFWLDSAGGTYQRGSANPTPYPTTVFQQVLMISVYPTTKNCAAAKKRVTVTLDPTCNSPAVRDFDCKFQINGPSRFTVCAAKNMVFPTGRYDGLSFTRMNFGGVGGNDGMVSYEWDAPTTANSSNPAYKGVGRVDAKYVAPAFNPALPLSPSNMPPPGTAFPAGVPPPYPANPGFASPPFVGGVANGVPPAVPAGTAVPGPVPAVPQPAAMPNWAPSVVSGDNGFWLISAGDGKYMRGSENPAAYPTAPFKQTLKISASSLDNPGCPVAQRDVVVTIDPTCDSPFAKDLVYPHEIMGPSNFSICVGSSMNLPTFYDNLQFTAVLTPDAPPNYNQVYGWDLDPTTSTRNPLDKGIGRIDSQFYTPGALEAKPFAPPVVSGDPGFWLVSAGNGRYQLGSASPDVYPTAPFKQVLKLSAHALNRNSIMATKEVTLTLDPGCVSTAAFNLVWPAPPGAG